MATSSASAGRDARPSSELAIYLHGFASSGHSTKAAYLGQRFRERGVDFLSPDLNLPDFSTLTVTRMLAQTQALIGEHANVTLIGSSLGGFVAVHAAARWPQHVKRLVLMAPALDFSDQGLSGPGGASLTQWKAAGQLTVFHYGYGRLLPVHYELYEDARRYDALSVDVKMPVLVFQGRRDTAVSPQTVERWCAARPNVELHMLDDEHQLTASLPYIWTQLERFTSRSLDSRL